MHQILQALSYIHSCGIIHRDIKPENILVQQIDDGIIKIKLADFGLSKIISPIQKLKMRCGTSQYLAPEILIEEGYHQEIDIWSAGVVFYGLMCNNKFPFQVNDKGDIFKSIMESEPNYCNQEFYFSSRESQNLIIKMVDKDPTQRISLDACFNHQFFKINGIYKKLKNGRKLKNRRNSMSFDQATLFPIKRSKTFLSPD